MAYQERLKDLKKAAQQMEHHAADAHPEYDWKNAPTDPAGSISRKSWVDSADVFVEQGETYSNHGQKR